MIPGCVCMTVGYLAITILRNRPSELGLPDFEEKNENDKNEENSDVDEKEESGFFSKSKLLFSYPFFISICLCYFIVQFIKTLYSDWSQIYLIKSYKISNYDGG